MSTTLPPLPEPAGHVDADYEFHGLLNPGNVFTADQMLSHREEYAKPLVDQVERALQVYMHLKMWPLVDEARAVLALYDKKD